MVEEVARVWSRSRTRSAVTEKPSAAFFVALVLRGRGMKITEGTVNDIIWGRNKLAERLSAYVISFLEKN
jgi:hypothetical protein